MDLADNRHYSINGIYVADENTRTIGPNLAGTGGSGGATWTLGTAVQINSDLTNVASDIIPDADNTRDIGSPTKRWANVYTADAHFNNVGTGGNDVDGTEGHWTMQEGADSMYLINRITGKKYKFNLTEVN